MSTPRDFLDAYTAAYEALDVDAFLSLYSDDVRVFDVAEPAEYPNKSAWSAQVTGWFGSLAGSAECEFDDVHIIESEELAVITTHVEYQGTVAGEEDEETQEMEIDARATFVLQKFDEEWLVIHEHTSIPVEFDEDDDWAEEEDEVDDVAPEAVNQ